MQRGGRGGVQFCRSTMLVEPRALERRSGMAKGSAAKYSGKTMPEDEMGCDSDHETQEIDNLQIDEWEVNEDDTIQEQVDVLHTFITTEECLWGVIDRYYGNPPHEGENVFCIFCKFVLMKE